MAHTPPLVLRWSRFIAERRSLVAAVHLAIDEMYSGDMDVAVTELRAHLSEWLSKVREGAEVLITDRGIPVARIVATDATDLFADLVARGVIGKPRSPRRPSAREHRRVRAVAPASSHVIDGRR